MKTQMIVTTLALVGAALPALALQFPDPVRPLVHGEPGYEMQQAQRAAKDDMGMDCSQMPCCKNMNMKGKEGADCMKMSKSECRKMLQNPHKQ
jgi:hypothetical protein